MILLLNYLIEHLKFLIIVIIKKFGGVIEIEGNLNGDFVVPSESALAYGFDGVSERFLVDDDKVIQYGK